MNPDFITGLRGVAFGVTVDAGHVYWTKRADVFGTSGTLIGRANLDATGVDQRFITGANTPGGIAVDALPGFGKVKRNKRRGSAMLTVVVPGPGELGLAKTREVRRANKEADAEGSVKLPVKPRAKAKKKLNKTARRRSRPSSPTPPTAASRTRSRSG